MQGRAPRTVPADTSDVRAMSGRAKQMLNKTKTKAMLCEHDWGGGGGGTERERENRERENREREKREQEAERERWIASCDRRMTGDA